ncbi:TetR/AcrR family transcriptional regulator [Streptomyces boncukensis]|uniref:TetR/AcrR family transcriptional regulator n=1 Tax=Streptomyces boncukensis TaxID=2711219 RepID=A0A6G4X109_9ACTN|nr:TetR/AcrR family transcriptional regulator [Streptomyces boncukensis]NGO70351.1 TetR/AcrR family transcriptional regulator [Streptomyces boncukensis]
MTTHTRSARTRPAKAPLSQAAVVGAALRIIESDGLPAVTMRRVAAELDTGPASLYAYVSNRDDLLRQTLDAALGTVPLEPIDPERWRSQLEALLWAILDAMHEYPGVAQVSFGRIPTGPASLAINEHISALLLAGGIPKQAAAWACDLFGLYVSAVAFEVAQRPEGGRAEEGAQHPLNDAQAERRRSSGVVGLLDGLPAERFPTLAALSGHLAHGTAEERFEFAVKIMVDGLLKQT